MKFALKIIGAAIALSLAGCGGNSGTSYSEPAGSGWRASFEFVTDQVLDEALARSQGVGSMPAPSSEIAYADTRAFDLAVYSSLKAYEGSPSTSVRIALPASTQTPPPRVAAWIAAAERQGGKVATCDVTPTEIGLSDLIAFGRAIWDIFGTRIVNYKLYSEALDYNAVIEVTSSPRTVRSVRLVNRRTSWDSVIRGYRSCEL